MKKMMQKMTRRIITVMLLMVMMCGELVSVRAAMPNLSSSCYMKTYSLSTGNNTPVFTSDSLNKRGTASPYKEYSATIYASDEIYVYSMNSTWAYVSYPTSSGRSYGYIATSSITQNNHSQAVVTSSGRFTTYKRANANASAGYVAKGDKVYTIASSGNWKQIIYESGSNWRMAWCSSSDYSRYVSASSSTSANTSISSTTSIIGGQSDIPKNGAFIRIRYAANGRYIDVPAESATKNGTQLQIWDSASSNINQYFQLIDTGKGWQIISLYSGKVVEVRDSSHKDYAQVAQWDKHDLACARWDIIQNNDGTVSFKNRESGLYLNVYGGGNASNGTKLIQYHNDGTVAMKFYINNVSTNGYQTQTKKISNSSVKSEKDISLTSWHPLKGFTKTMLEQDDSLEAIVNNVPVGLDVVNFVFSWIGNSKEITRIHVTQGNNNNMTIQYGSSIEENLSGKKISLSTLLVQRYYNFSPTMVFSSNTKADECIRNWFNITGSGQYSMELSFGKVNLGEYGYYLMIKNGIVYQVPIINDNSSYKVYRSLNGKTSYMFDAAQLLRNARLQLDDNAAMVVMQQLVKNGYIK